MKKNKIVFIMMIFSIVLLLSCSTNNPVSNTISETNNRNINNTSITGKAEFPEITSKSEQDLNDSKIIVIKK